MENFRVNDVKKGHRKFRWSKFLKGRSKGGGDTTTQRGRQKGTILIVGLNGKKRLSDILAVVETFFLRRRHLKPPPRASLLLGTPLCRPI